MDKSAAPYLPKWHKPEACGGTMPEECWHLTSRATMPPCPTDTTKPSGAQDHL